MAKNFERKDFFWKEMVMHGVIFCVVVLESRDIQTMRPTRSEAHFNKSARFYYLITSDDSLHS